MIQSARSLVECETRGVWLMLVLLAAATSAWGQTRDYNPIRRTAATQEQSVVEQPQPATTPRTAQAETWSPPTHSGPPGQWKSMRQPGPVQLPARQYLPSRPSAHQPVGTPPETSAPLVSPPEEIPADIAPGAWQHGGEWNDGPSCHGPNCGDHCGGECGHGCNSCCEGSRGFGLCGGDCGNCGSCLGHWWPQCWQLFGGVHGFKGPPDRGNNGNFGFHEGINFSGMFKPACGIGYQVGGQWVHSNLEGDTTVGTRAEDRSQSFFTAGLFRRACGPGLQGGVVWDLLHDDYYVDMTLSQIRGELSFVGFRCHEFGFMFATGVEDDADTLNNFQDIWEPTDQYAFFYRRPFGCGSHFRVWAGFTDHSDGLLGGEFSMPISARLSLASNFNYLIPDEEGAAAISEEAWALGITLVWYPGRAGRCNGPCMPLFNVADNASFLVDRHQTVLTAPN